MITLVPITDAAHLVHGPIGCAGNSWDSRGSLSSGPTLYRRGFTTDLDERAVVFGGERRLAAAIDEVIARHQPSAVFVYSTCVPAMIGDDLEAVCAAARARAGVPVIPVPSAGFLGGKNHGGAVAGRVLLDHVIGTVEPPPGADQAERRLDVNLVGEYNIAGELWGVLPLLDRLGLRVLGRVTGDARYQDVAVSHRAKVTMVVCSRALLSLAKELERRYGVPWFEGSFYGLAALRSALRGFAAALASLDPELPARAESVIAEEEAAAEEALAPYRRRLRGVRAVLYTGGVKSWSMVGALADVGVEVVGSGATKSTPGDIERMRELLGPGGRVIEDGDPANLLAIVRDTGARLLVAGGRNQYTALKSRIPFVDVNQERHVPFAGYAGLVELARQVDLAVSSPVWRVVGDPPPWERSADLPSRAPLLAGVA